METPPLVADQNEMDEIPPLELGEGEDKCNGIEDGIRNNSPCRNSDSPPTLLPAVCSFPRLSLRRCSYRDEYCEQSHESSNSYVERNNLFSDIEDKDGRIQSKDTSKKFTLTTKKQRKKYSNPFLCNRRRKTKCKSRIENLKSVQNIQIDGEKSISPGLPSGICAAADVLNCSSDQTDSQSSENQTEVISPSAIFLTPKKKQRKCFLLTPYLSKRGYNGWEDCLRQRPTQVEHYQSRTSIRNRFILSPKEKGEALARSDVKLTLHNGDISSRLKPKKVGEITCSMKRIKHKSTTHEKTSLACGKNSSLVCLNGELKSNYEENSKCIDAAVGDVVWAKLGSTRWWPAMIIWGNDCGQSPARLGLSWVFWFGDHKISELPRDKLQYFVSEFLVNYSDFAGKLFERAVHEALVVIVERAQIDFEEDFEWLVKWAKKGFTTKRNKPNPFAPDSGLPVPESVRRHLNRIKVQYFESLELNGSSSKKRTVKEINEDSALMKVRQGQLKIQDVCIACDSYTKEIVTQHPLFHGGLCGMCKEDLVETMFAFGDDGSNVYCVICSQPGELLICDNHECNRCYCTTCIETLVAPGAHQTVLETSPWPCYLCSKHDPDVHGLFKKNEDWQQNIMQFFQPPNHVIMPPSLDEYKEKRGVRVLSLFDGIGTGKYVLDQLGIEVEAYYASEIDQDAINVAVFQHQTSIKQLGRIESITDVEVAELCPLDLIIGGSPCNDLSLVNPARKGLFDHTGTGKLFFDFYRILKTVQLTNHGRHVFWLFENVASMPHEYKALITRFLLCEPVMIDSKYFSPQNRARYFWGNIPGMYTVEESFGQAEFSIPVQNYYGEEKSTLDNVLVQGLNRKAMVEKIHTVTTRSNSLKQGKRCIMPVTMNGDGDVLWVTELEQVFGFPRHYTDVGNIPLGRRQQLLGKAWSVPVIKHLLTPLRSFFKTTQYFCSSSLDSPPSNA